MIAVWSYRWEAVESPLPSSNSSDACSGEPLRFFGFGIGVMNSAAAAFEDLLGRLTLLVELPMAGRAAVGRVEDGMVEEGIAHDSRFGGPKHNAAGTLPTEAMLSPTSAGPRIFQRSSRHSNDRLGHSPNNF